MDQTKNQIPFDPDFDAGSSHTSTASNLPTQSALPPDFSGANPVMTFYAGLACSVVIFGLAGIIFLLTLIN